MGTTFTPSGVQFRTDTTESSPDPTALVVFVKYVYKSKKEQFFNEAVSL